MGISFKRTAGHPPRFIREAATVLDLPAMLQPPEPVPEVWDALGRDWAAIGEDFRVALRAFDQAKLIAG